MSSTVSGIKCPRHERGTTKTSHSQNFLSKHQQCISPRTLAVCPVPRALLPPSACERAGSGGFCAIPFPAPRESPDLSFGPAGHPGRVSRNGIPKPWIHLRTARTAQLPRSGERNASKRVLSAWRFRISSQEGCETAFLPRIFQAPAGHRRVSRRQHAVPARRP